MTHTKTVDGELAGVEDPPICEYTASVGFCATIAALCPVPDGVELLAATVRPIVTAELASGTAAATELFMTGGVAAKGAV